MDIQISNKETLSNYKNYEVVEKPASGMIDVLSLEVFKLRLDGYFYRMV